MNKLQVLIVDDERTAREEVKRLLADYPDFEIMGEARNADEAKELIALKHPDLLLLDIQMPEKSGFDLLESLDEVPQVIFVTAFDHYAVKAFEVSALDYLMKPVREERFARAMEQVRLRLAKPASKQLFVKDGQQYHFVTWDKVYLIESMDNYARLFFEDKKVFLKSSLNQLEKKLEGAVFFRINRGQIINTKFIEKMSTAPGGKIKLSMETGAVLEMSERQSVKFRSMGRFLRP